MGAGLCSEIPPGVPLAGFCLRPSQVGTPAWQHIALFPRVREKPALSTHLAPRSTRLHSPGPLNLTPRPQPPQVFWCDRNEGLMASPPRQEIPTFLGPWPKMTSPESLGWWDCWPWTQVFHQPQYKWTPFKKNL